MPRVIKAAERARLQEEMERLQEEERQQATVDRKALMISLLRGASQDVTNNQPVAAKRRIAAALKMLGC